jgi:hypothetical protein
MPPSPQSRPPPLLNANDLARIAHFHDGDQAQASTSEDLLQVSGWCAHSYTAATLIEVVPVRAKHLAAERYNLRGVRPSPREAVWIAAKMAHLTQAVLQPSGSLIPPRSVVVIMAAIASRCLHRTTMLVGPASPA